VVGKATFGRTDASLDYVNGLELSGENLTVSYGGRYYHVLLVRDSDGNYNFLDSRPGPFRSRPVAGKIGVGARPEDVDGAWCRTLSPLDSRTQGPCAGVQ
jgi:hypothetical protein